MLIVTEQVPVVPDTKVPAAAPPTVELAEQPFEAKVNLVPVDIKTGASRNDVEGTNTPVVVIYGVLVFPEV